MIGVILFLALLIPVAMVAFAFYHVFRKPKEEKKFGFKKTLEEGPFTCEVGFKDKKEYRELMNNNPLGIFEQFFEGKKKKK